MTNDKHHHDIIKTLSSHGMIKAPIKLKTLIGRYYEMHQLGYNYRITDIQCALGISQLKKINYFIEKEKILHRYMIIT